MKNEIGTITTETTIGDSCVVNSVRDDYSVMSRAVLIPKDSTSVICKLFKPTGDEISQFNSIAEASDHLMDI